ncbi:MAG: hypothetical protein ACFFCG_12485, partial [Promethearchaeota archaeon]
GKYPRQPNGSAVLATCREDFRKFKEENGNALLEHLSILITDLERRGIDPEIYKRQKENLEEIKSLIKKGEEKFAFTRFTRAFPYCLPHRSIL